MLSCAHCATGLGALQGCACPLGERDADAALCAVFNACRACLSNNATASSQGNKDALLISARSSLLFH